MLNKAEDTSFTFTLPSSDLLYVVQCLNEIINGIQISDREIETRIGTDRKHLSEILDRLAAKIDSGTP